MNKAAIARKMLERAGWQLIGEPPADPVALVIAAPHTSNWDLPLMLAMTRAVGISPHFLMKKELFRGPVAPLMRAIGAVPVDRAAAAGVVEGLVAQARSGEHFHLVIAPEGTRKPGKYWKSGFYRIASQANIPIVMGSCDGPSRTVMYGPTLRPSGDVRADMDIVRAFYADKRGVNPAKRTEPRLREEDEPAR